MHARTHVHIDFGAAINIRPFMQDQTFLHIDSLTIVAPIKLIRELRDKLSDYLIERAVRTADPTVATLPADSPLDPRD